MTGVEIGRISVTQKYKFIKSNFLHEITTVEEQVEINGTRNRLIHFGLLPNGTNSTTIDNFFRDTEKFVANILGLID
jgi:hypothetical protein